MNVFSGEISRGNGDQIYIDNFDNENPLDNPSVESFQFADGSSLTWNDLLARGFDLDGTAGDDTIIGTGVDDRLDGKAGDDLIFGLDGNDLLTGGAGTDGLNGGLGDDTYVFNAGDSPTLTTQSNGQAVTQTETLVDEGGNDTVRFGADVDPANLVVRDNHDGSLLVDYHAANAPLDRLLVVDGLQGNIEHWKLGAGDTAPTLDYEQFIGTYAHGRFSATDGSGTLHLAAGQDNDEATCRLRITRENSRRDAPRWRCRDGKGSERAANDCETRSVA